MTEKCKTCWGYGLWAIGDASPMGPIDFEDGEPNKKCSECGSGKKSDYLNSNPSLKYGF